MRRLLAAIAMFVLLASSAPGIASAHELQQDHGVSAVLHIPPFDAPEANTPQTIEFELGSTVSAFSLNDYMLTLTVSDEGKTILRKPATPAFFGSATRAKADITFPAIAVYDIALEGASLTPGKPNFAVSYSVRVASSSTGSVPGSMKQGNGTQAVLISATIFIVFVMIAARQITSGGRYSKATKTK